MSDGFPLGLDDQHPPHLTEATFTACYHALAKLIDEETPVPTTPVGPAPPGGRELILQQAYGELDYWYDHASDGDLTALPGESHATWNDLDLIRDQLRRDADQLGSDVQAIETTWQGPAGLAFGGYLRTMQRRVEGYAEIAPGNSGDNGCYIAQVGTLLHAAYAAQAAYKKDLYQIAKGARDSMKAIDDGGSTSAEVGLLTLAIAGVALTGAGAAIAGSELVGAVFLGSVVGQTGGFAFSKATSKVHIGGDTPAAIMTSAGAAVKSAIDHYGAACQHVSSRMDMLWRNLVNEYQTVPPPPDLKSVDTSNLPSIATLK